MAIKRNRKSYGDTPAEQKVIKRILEDTNSGYTARMVADDLNKDGTTSPSGKPWTMKSVSSLIGKHRDQLNAMMDARLADQRVNQASLPDIRDIERKMVEEQGGITIGVSVWDTEKEKMKMEYTEVTPEDLRREDEWQAAKELLKNEGTTSLRFHEWHEGTDIMGPPSVDERGLAKFSTKATGKRAHELLDELKTGKPLLQSQKRDLRREVNILLHEIAGQREENLALRQKREDKNSEESYDEALNRCTKNLRAQQE